MSSRVGPLVLAIASFAVRTSGDHVAADVLALASLGMLTIAVQRSVHLQAAATAVRVSDALAAVRNSETA